MENGLLQPGGDGQPKMSALVEEDDLLKSNTKKKIIHQSTILAIGAVGIFASYSGVSSLQSTLNFEESIGTTSLALCFAAAILTSATIASVVLDRAGAKVMLVFSEATFVLYSLANVYPAKFTLYPAAILLGVGEAFIWPAVMTFNTCYASAIVAFKIDKLSETSLSVHRQMVEKKICRFSGRFYSIFSAYLVIGNMMAYAILKFDQTGTDHAKNNQTNVTSDRMLACGALDCYEYDAEPNNATKPNKLELSNDTLRYILFAAYTLLQLCCCVLHKLFLIEPTRLFQSKNICRRKTASIRTLAAKLAPSFLRQATNPKQLLLMPLTVYNGLMIAFIFGDFTRSYIACPLSVHEIGLLMTIFGITSALASYVFQFSSNYVNKSYSIGVALTTEAFILLWCFLWRASGSSVWQVYAIAGLMGVGDSVRETSLSAIYPVLFRDDGPMGLNFLSMLTASGIATMYAISTEVCLFTKLIILSASLAYSAICYCVLEIRFS